MKSNDPSYIPSCRRQIKTVKLKEFGGPNEPVRRHRRAEQLRGEPHRESSSFIFAPGGKKNLDFFSRLSADSFRQIMLKMLLLRFYTRSDVTKHYNAPAAACDAFRARQKTKKVCSIHLLSFSTLLIFPPVL